MAGNRDRGEATFEVEQPDGTMKTFTLVLNFHAWALAQDRLTEGIEVPQVEILITRLQRRHLMTAIAVTWAALQKKHPEIDTLDKTTDLMEDSKGESARALLKALGWSMADAADVAELTEATRPNEAQDEATSVSEEPQSQPKKTRAKSA
jgi:hypothetical protein